MKLVDLKCPNCGASLKVQDNWGELCHCKHCDSSFVLQRPAPTINQTVNNYYGAEAKKMVTRVPAKMVVLVPAIFIIAVVAVNLIVSWISSLSLGSAVQNFDEKQDQHEVAEAVQHREIPESEPVRQFVVSVFGYSDVADIKQEDLSRLRYLQVSINDSDENEDRFLFSYSFEAYDPISKKGAEQIQRVLVDSDQEVDWLDLQCFTELTAVVIDASKYINYPYEREIQPLPLHNLEYYGSYQGATAILKSVQDPTRLTGLEVTLDGQEDVTALTSFTGLRSLRVNRSSDHIEGLQELSALTQLETLTLWDAREDISWLSAMTSVKNLTIEWCSNIDDFSVLSGMPALESLEIYRPNKMKSIGFVTNMPNLQRLVIVRSEVKDISPLSGKLSMTYLELADNKIEDYSPIQTLTSLRGLSLQERGGGPQLPDLSGLTFLEEVEITSKLLPMVEKCSNIRVMKLHLSSDFDMRRLLNLTALEQLTVEGGYSYVKDTTPLRSLPELRELTLHKVRFYNDVQTGSVFAIPGLERLWVTECSFTHFSGEVVPQNADLVSLRLEECQFFLLADKKTYKIPGALDQLILSYPALEELYLPGSGISDIGFMQQLEALQVVDIRDCYVTDISPLAKLKDLRYVNVWGTPVENLPLIEGKATVVR